MLGVSQTNVTTTSNPGGEGRVPGGLGGLGLPGMEQMVNGMPDASLLNQFMQNPAMSQMMQSLLSNPQYMNQVLFEIVKFSVLFIHFGVKIPRFFCFS